MDWVMMKRWVIILLKRQFSGKTVSRITGSLDQGSRITGSRIKDHWIKDQGFELILPISVSGPKALCNPNCSIFPQCSKAGSKVNVGSLSLS